MAFIYGVIIISGITFLLYYVVIICYSGIRTSFAWFWLFSGISCVLLSFRLKYKMEQEIPFGKPFDILLTGILILGLCIFIMIMGVIIFYSKQITDPGADYVIVLGAHVKGMRITRTLRARLEAAADYLIGNPATVAIVSGGQGKGEDVTEADAMERYLVSRGIAVNRILREEKSTDTNENIRFSRKAINHPTARVVIATSAFHIFRATRIARKQGLSRAQGLPSPSDPVLLIHYYVREVIGVMKDKVLGNL